MALNFNSQYGIIIGVVTTLACLPIIESELQRSSHILTHYGDYYFSWINLIDAVGMTILTILSCIFSIVLILGIVMKRHILLAAWLVVGFLTSMYSSCVSLYYTMRHFHVDHLLLLFVVIGLEVVAWYPINNLYAEMRRENRESMVTYNIRNGCEKDSKETIV